MANRKRTILQVLGYTLYGVVAFLVFLYVMFPYDLLRQRLVEGLSQGEMRLSIARLQPDLPPGLGLYNVRLLNDTWEIPGALMQIQTLHLQPAWLSLLSETPQAHFEAALYRGTMAGEILSSKANAAEAWEVRGRFEELQVEHHPWLQKEGQVLVSGRLGGDLSLVLQEDGLIQQGTVNLLAQPAVFRAAQGLQLSPKRDITCDTLQSQLKMTASQLQIVSFSCKGNDLSIQARGTIDWRQTLRDSGLSLHLQLRSESVYKQELALIGGLLRRPVDRRGVLSFSIRGTMQRPRFGA